MRGSDVVGGVCVAAARVIAGLAAWSLAEYATHRFPMHARRGSSPLADEHLGHHADPSQTVRLALDTHNLLFKGAAFAAGTVLGSAAFGAGFTGGYGAYTFLHHNIHHRAPRSAWATEVWRRHHQHHFAQPSRNFGVTSHVWDRVFRSVSDIAGPVRVPAGRAPGWMSDHSGYEVVTRR